MPDIQCNVANCEYNINGECENCDVIIEDKQCISVEIDDHRCDVCGSQMKIVKERLEHFGVPCYLEYFECPKGCA